MAASRSILVLLLCLAGVAGSLAQTGKPTVRRRAVLDPAATAMARAEAAIDRKDYAAAESALNEALQHAPNSYRAWFDLGFVYTALGRKTEAIEAYRKSVAADASVFESNLNLGLMLAAAGDAEAEKYLRAATQLKPTARVNEGHARAWLSLGHLLESKDPTGALAAFRRAAELTPSDPGPHLAAAIVAEKRQEFATAEEEFKAAATRNPKSVEAAAGLANVYMQTRRLPQAEAALRSYLRLQPDSATAHLQLARVLARQDKRDQAQPEFETALRLAPDDLEARRELASLYIADKQYEKARQQLVPALEKNPGDAQLRHLLGNVLMNERNFPQAQAELLQAVKLKPDLVAAYGDLAFVASENKNYVLAIQVLDARARLAPETPGTLFLRATAYDHLRDYKQAAAGYHQFLAAANGRFPDEEWKARHRLIAIEPKK